MAEPSYLGMEDVKMLLDYWYDQQSKGLPALHFHHTQTGEDLLPVNIVGGRKEGSLRKKESLQKEERLKKEESLRKGQKKQAPYKCSEEEGRGDGTAALECHQNFYCTLLL